MVSQERKEKKKEKSLEWRRKLWRFSISKDGSREKNQKKKREKKEQALKQRSVHFQTSLTRFHVFHREINPDEAGNSAPTQRQRTATFNVKIFHGGRIFSFLFFSVDPKRDLGQWRAISSRLSVPLIRPSRFLCFLPSKVFSLPPDRFGNPV